MQYLPRPHQAGSARPSISWPFGRIFHEKCGLAPWEKFHPWQALEVLILCPEDRAIAPGGRVDDAVGKR
jgi:hypothetical protein